VKRLLIVLALLVALLTPSLASATAPLLSCGTPTHLTFDNAHGPNKDGYGSGGSTVQMVGNTFVQMDVWSPDARVPATDPPTTSQTIDVCSLSEWNATITETDGSNPRVFTYPNSDDRVTTYDGSCKQAWSAYTTITGSWAIDAPAKGDWDESWDFWMGDFGGCHQTGIPQIELMVYTKWYQNVFAPTAMANFTTPDGNNYDAWWSWNANGSGGCGATAGCVYLQTRLTTQAGSGTLHLRQIMQKLYGNGYTYHDGTDKPIMPYGAQYADGQYGVELVSGVHTVADGPITFHLTNFSVTKN
jgi:hypothetical protein